AVAVLGYDPQYGARPVKRVVQQKIENPLAQFLLRANEESKQILVDYYPEDGFKIGYSVE
ncbi:MAG: hypothetical protein AAF939_17405, partial [Planctomycetota bacterium]